MKISLSTLLVITGLLVLFPNGANAKFPLKLSYCPRFNETTNVWDYTFMLEKTGKHFQHRYASQIIFGNTAPSEAAELLNFVATSVSPPYSTIEEVEVSRVTRPYHKGQMLAHSSIPWYPNVQGDYLSWTRTAENFVPNNLYWSFLQGTFPRRDYYILASLMDDCPDTPEPSEAPSLAPSLSQAPSDRPSVAPSGVPSSAPSYACAVCLFYCPQKERPQDHVWMYSFTLQQMVNGYRDNTIGGIFYIDLGSTHVIDDFTPTSDAPAPFYNFGRRYGPGRHVGYALEPAATLESRWYFRPHVLDWRFTEIRRARTAHLELS